MTFDTDKPGWRGYRVMKRFENMFTYFDTIHKRARQRDRHGRLRYA